MKHAYIIACAFNGAAAFLLGIVIMAGMFSARPVLGIGVCIFGLFGFSYSIYKLYRSGEIKQGVRK